MARKIGHANPSSLCGIYSIHVISAILMTDGASGDDVCVQTFGNNKFLNLLIIIDSRDKQSLWHLNLENKP